MSVLSIALFAALTACGEETKYGKLRVSYDDGWMNFDSARSTTLENGERPRLALCGANDPERIVEDDETGACIEMRFDETVLGTGPMTLSLTGSVVVTPRGITREATFTPHEGHSPGVLGVWVETECFAPPPARAITQEITGQLVLEENSTSRLRGRLVMRSEGPTFGPCQGDETQAELDFDMPRP